MKQQYFNILIIVAVNIFANYCVSFSAVSDKSSELLISMDRERAISKISYEKDKIEEYDRIILDLDTKINKINSMESSISVISDNLKKIKNLTSNIAVDSKVNSKVIKNIIELVAESKKEFTKNITSIYRKVGKDYFAYRIFGTQPRKTKLNSIIEQFEIIGKFSDSDHETNAVQVLTPIVKNENKSETNEIVINEDTLNILNTLNISLFDNIFREKKESVVKWLNTLKISVNELRSQSQSILSQEKLKIEKLTDEIAKIEKEKKKTFKLTNLYKDVSVNLMIIGIIVILILLVRISKDNEKVALQLIQERTLVEILSMGFLLLSVIILGTTKMITAETLGTLLGTIAGYIFGKESNRKQLP